MAARRTTLFVVVVLLVMLIRLYVSSRSSNEEPMTSTQRSALLFATDATLLVWTTVYCYDKFENYYIDYCGSGRPKCLLTHKRELLPDVPTILFFARDSNRADLPPKGKQPWVLWSEEPPDRFIGYKDADFASMFDRSMTYRLDSDYPVPFLSKYTVAAAMQPMSPPLDSRHQDVPVVWIASNCASYNGRETFVRELSRYVKVDSYGGCMNNKAFPTNNSLGDDIFSSTLHVLRQYKFYLSLENTNCRDYVTEKLHNAIAAATVPIIIGAKDLNLFLPSSHSALIVDDYYSVHDLAKHILYLHHNDTAYMEYHSYRQGNRSALNAAFVNTWDGPDGEYDKRGFCMLCEESVKWQRGEPVAPREQTGYHRTRPALNVSEILTREGNCEPRNKYWYTSHYNNEDWQAWIYPIQIVAASVICLAFVGVLLVLGKRFRGRSLIAAVKKS